MRAECLWNNWIETHSSREAEKMVYKENSRPYENRRPCDWVKGVSKYGEGHMAHMIATNLTTQHLSHKGLRPDGKGLHSAFEIDLHYHEKPSSHTLSWLQYEHMLSSHSSFIILVLNFSTSIVPSEIILCNWISSDVVKLFLCIPIWWSAPKLNVWMLDIYSL